MIGYSAAKDGEAVLVHEGFDLAGLEALDAFVDGELDGMQQAVAAAAIYSDPEASARVLDYREQNVGLKALFDNVLDESIPARMQMLVNSYACEWRQAS